MLWELDFQKRGASLFVLASPYQGQLRGPQLCFERKVEELGNFSELY